MATMDDREMYKMMGAGLAVLLVALPGGGAILRLVLHASWAETIGLCIFSAVLFVPPFAFGLYKVRRGDWPYRPIRMNSPIGRWIAVLGLGVLGADLSGAILVSRGSLFPGIILVVIGITLMWVLALVVLSHAFHSDR